MWSAGETSLFYVTYVMYEVGDILISVFLFLFT